MPNKTKADKLQERVHELEIENGAFKAQVAQMQAQLDEYTDRLEEKRDKHAKASVRVEALETRTKQLSRENDTLRAHNADLAGNLSRAKGYIDRVLESDLREKGPVSMGTRQNEPVYPEGPRFEGGDAPIMGVDRFRV